MEDQINLFPLSRNAEKFAAFIALSAVRYNLGINKTQDRNWIVRIRRHYADLCTTDLSPARYTSAWQEGYKEAGAADLTGVSFNDAFPEEWLAQFSASAR